MLGIERIPPDPARSLLTFSATPSTVVVPRGTQAQTAATETQAPIVFETDSDVKILPINLEASLLISKVIFNKYSNVSNDFTVPPAPGSTINIAPSQAVQLCLGFDNASTQTIDLMLRMFAPLAAGAATVTWTYSQSGVEPSSWTALTVPASADGTRGLTQDGDVSLTVPNDWASEAPPSWTTVQPASSADVVTSAYYWIGLRIANLSATEPLALGLSWALFNAVSSYSALTISAPESLGNGDGTPFQVCSLANGPLFAIPDSATPYSHLVVQVNGVTWSQVDDFPAGPGQFYRVDPVASQISFGNYNVLTNVGHGTIPQSSDAIVATTYRYVEAGATANVGAASIVAMRTPVAGITAVTNLFAAYGGSDEQSIDDAKRRGPEMLRNRGRAVTVEDYNFLAMQASSELSSVACLAPYDPYAPPPFGTGPYGDLQRGPGNVNVIIVPALAPSVSATPQPTPELLQQVVAYLDGRCDLTALLNVTGPRYLPIEVAVSAAPWQSAINSGLISSPSDVQTYIEERITLYFHPVVGGADGTGWRVGQNVYIADLYKSIMPPENVGFISEVTVQAGTPLYVGGRPFAAGPAGAWVRLADYELVCLGSVNFTLGPPL
jgi:predicted phage baseplate assembly protein